MMLLRAALRVLPWGCLIGQVGQVGRVGRVEQDNRISVEHLHIYSNLGRGFRPTCLTCLICPIRVQEKRTSEGRSFYVVVFKVKGVTLWDPLLVPLLIPL